MVRENRLGAAPAPPPAADGPGLLTEQDFDVLVRGSWLPLVRLGFLLLGDRSSAEDAVQDACAALAGRWSTMTSVPGAGAYLRTSVVNASRSALRRRRVANAARLAAVDRPADAADLPLLVAERQREVVTALSKLPKRQREVIVLRYWSELSEADIASTLGISNGSVKSASSRGIAKLGALLGDTT